MDDVEEHLSSQLPDFITISLGPENGIKVDLGSFHPLMAYAVFTSIVGALQDMIEEPEITFNGKTVYSLREVEEGEEE